jgi:ABC-type glycerol-3-phosphate transport system substrate-binding protein
MFRTLSTVLATVLGAGAMLTACDNSKREVVVLGEDSANIQAMEQTRTGFESSGSTRLRFEKVSFEDAETKAIQDFFNKSGKYDVVLQYNFLLSSFVRNGYVSPLSELKKGVPAEKLAFESDITPKGWKEVGYYYKAPYTPESEIQAIGYPFAINTMLLVYNKKMFSEPSAIKAYAARYKGKALEPPKTWEDFRNVAEFFTNKSSADTSLHTHGLVLQGAADGWLYYEWMNFLFGQGGRTMNKEFGWMGGRNTQVELDSPTAIAAAKYYTSLKPFNAGDFFTTKPEQQMERLRGGKVAMAIMWTDYVPELIQLGKPEGQRVSSAAEFGFAPTPGNVSMLAGGAYFINARSKNKSEAFRYVIHLMQRETQIELARKGLASPLDSVYDDPGVSALPYATALRASQRRGVYMNEAGPEAGMIRATVEKYLQQAWRGDVDEEKALKNARTEIEASRTKIFDQIQLTTK